ncbi:MAG: hypothetical protein MJA82_00985, partial [Clostridia bacterium]|nr:hypothetical protein [Clostridia bacterium]
MDKNYLNRQKTSEYIIEKIINNMSGAGLEGEYCKFNKPSDVYSIGSLAPRPEKIVKTDEDEFYADFLARFAPHSMGLEFLGKINGNSRLKINLSFNVYYRVIPTYEVQQKINESKSMAVVFKKKEVKDIEIKLNLKDVLSSRIKKYNLNDFQNLKKQLQGVYKEILQDEYTFREKEIRIRDEIMKDKKSYLSEVSKILSENKTCPEWDIELHLEARNYDTTKQFIQVIIINASDPQNIYSKVLDNYLFDVKLEISLENGKLYPFIFNLLEDSYRYDRNMWGVGINCSVNKSFNEDILITENSPIHKQARYGTRDEMPNGDKVILPEFMGLADEPIDLLIGIKEQMEEYRDHCLANPDDFIGGLGKKKDDIDKFKDNLKDFDDEIKRFQLGINLLKKARKETSKYHIVYKAFKFMNEVFYEGGLKRNFTFWRTFQIVFIVSNLIDVVEQHWPGTFKENNIDKVSVLWFPTGGGKTEAYLGLVVFNLFFDRLRGKSDGVTALFKFPLRILSLQQFQRIFSIIMIANQVKTKYKIVGKLFSIGHWVGNNQTPNNIENISKEWKKDIELLKKGVNSGEDWENAQQKLRRINECPVCKGNVKVIWYSRRQTLMHKCTNKKCSYDISILPIYITDTDIYRYLPSAIVSTVDKIATAGMQVKFSNILGNVKYFHKDQGYSWNKAKDDEDNVVEISQQQRKLLRPTLQIQDELHLIKEDLGAYNSHYETMLQQIQKNISENYSWKTIASTATIQDYNRHISHLYGKKENKKMSIRFPVEGPKSDESFYSKKDKYNSIGRYFVGIIGHNKTHINTTVDVIYYFHR